MLKFEQPSSILLQTLATGQSTQMTMTYSPTRVKTEQPYIEIASNDPNKPLFRVPIKAVNYYEIPSSDLPLSSLHGATDSPDTAVGQTSTVKFRYTNIGAGNMSVTSVTSDNTLFTIGTMAITDTHGASTGATIPATVEPGCYMEFTVVFTPTSSGYQTATITGVTNDKTNPSFKVPVAANGL